MQIKLLLLLSELEEQLREHHMVVLESMVKILHLVFGQQKEVVAGMAPIQLSVELLGDLAVVVAPLLELLDLRM
jgi:hypothetical protein